MVARATNRIAGVINWYKRYPIDFLAPLSPSYTDLQATKLAVIAKIVMS